MPATTFDRRSRNRLVDIEEAAGERIGIEDTVKNSEQKTAYQTNYSVAQHLLILPFSGHRLTGSRYCRGRRLDRLPNFRRADWARWRGCWPVVQQIQAAAFSTEAPNASWQ